MISEVYQNRASEKQLFLDPRTKMVLCLSVSTTLISGTSIGYLAYFHYALALLPLAFLLMLKEYRRAVQYILLYAFVSIVPGLIMPYLPQVVNLLFTGIVAFSKNLIPGGMMCYFLLATTSVSEFVAVMDRMHITKKVSVPISVMFRFFPTIKEEYRAVQNAMKLRNVGTLRNPIKMLEYRLVPFLISVVSIGNDLSASALTRGLTAPCKRTDLGKIGFTWRDGLAFALLVAFFAGYALVAFLQSEGQL